MVETNKIIQGNALEVLKTFPNESIDCVVTSPPYWALRDYGIDGQLGLENTFKEYIKKLCDIFDEAKRVLKKSGTCWINLGDTYFGSNSDSSAVTNLKSKQAGYELNAYPSKSIKNGKYYQNKSLCMIPFRFAIEMVNRGWVLRNNIIWHKPNCMPSSVKDRFTVDFEYVFFFVKSKKYYFEQQYEPMAESTKERYNYGWNGNIDRGYITGPQNHLNKHIGTEHSRYLAENIGRNKRAVWTISPKPFPDSHFAVFPEELIEPMIKAGCPKDGIVLDPFIGSGTTGLVALKQNKKFVGIELNPKYIEMAYKRLKPYLEQTKLKEVATQ